MHKSDVDASTAFAVPEEQDWFEEAFRTRSETALRAALQLAQLAESIPARVECLFLDGWSDALEREVERQSALLQCLSPFDFGDCKRIVEYGYEAELLRRVNETRMERDLWSHAVSEFEKTGRVPWPLTSFRYLAGGDELQLRELLDDVKSVKRN